MQQQKTRIGSLVATGERSPGGGAGTPADAAAGGLPLTYSLSEIHSVLQSEYGHLAPSLVTLKRASASGKLDPARVQGSGRTRVRFKLSVVRRIMMRTEALVPPVEAERSEVQSLAVSIDLDELADKVVARVLAQLPGFAHVGAVMDAVKDLRMARTSLMAKYDQAHTAQTELARVSRPAGGGSGADVLEFARIQSALARIEGLLRQHLPNET